MVDAVIQPTESKFSKYVEQIELSLEKMNNLKDAAHVAQQNDMQDTVKDTGHSTLTRSNWVIRICN